MSVHHINFKSRPTAISNIEQAEIEISMDISDCIDRMLDLYKGINTKEEVLIIINNIIQNEINATKGINHD